VGTEQLRNGGVLTVTLEWRAHAALPASDAVFVHVLDGSGAKVAQVDVPLGGGAQPAALDPQAFATQVEALQVPRPRPGDQYWIVVGVYDMASTQRARLSAPAMSAVPSSGPDSLTLGAVEDEPQPRFVPQSALLCPYQNCTSSREVQLALAR
jgi:hypothetical protein